MSKVLLSTLFWRPVNLLRGKETRANSRYTSAWGLGQLLSRDAGLQRMIRRNLEDRLLAGQLSLPGLVRLAVRGGEQLKVLAEQVLLDQPAFHRWGVRELNRYLKDKKMEVECGFEPWGSRHVEYVYANYPVRLRAQAVLKEIGRLHQDQLGDEIKAILENAPIAHDKSRIIQ